MRKRVAQRNWATSASLKKQSKMNNHPIVKNSAHLITLIATDRKSNSRNITVNMNCAK
jgi:hypothetical protein